MPYLKLEATETLNSHCSRQYKYSPTTAPLLSRRPTSTLQVSSSELSNGELCDDISAQTARTSSYRMVQNCTEWPETSQPPTDWGTWWPRTVHYGSCWQLSVQRTLEMQANNGDNDDDRHSSWTDRESWELQEAASRTEFSAVTDDCSDWQYAAAPPQLQIFAANTAQLNCKWRAVITASKKHWRLSFLSLTSRVYFSTRSTRKKWKRSEIYP